MSSITRLLLNLSIGAKLGIASGLGVLLVATMVIVQIRSNAAMRDLDARMVGTADDRAGRGGCEGVDRAACRLASATFVSPTVRPICRKPTTISRPG